MKQNLLSKSITDNFRKTFFAGIFFIALSTLLLEYTLTRILSVSLWYHFAFMIISVALLGFGISGVILALSKKINLIPSEKLLTILSIFFGVSIIASFLIINQIPFDPFSLLTNHIQFLYLPLYYITITIPFIFPGLIVSILLTRYKSKVSKLYFFDLLGASISCFIFILFIPALGGNGLIIICASFSFISAMIFSFKNHKVLFLISVILFFLEYSFLIDKDVRFPIYVTENKLYSKYISDRPDLKIKTEWNTFSKVDVMRDEEKSPDGYDIYLAIIDEGNSTTNIPNVKSLPIMNKPADASNLAFAHRDTTKNVFIIGSAGGGEILTSLYHNAEDITAVEINGILNDLIKNKLSYWTGPLVRNKSVRLITDDARAVLSSKRIVYDVIISAHTISSSAVSSGAMSMVENFILTKEAAKEYIQHLKNDGIMYITRPETQIPKLITTFRIVRKETSKGTEDSKNNFIVFRRPPHNFEFGKSFLAGILYKKNGFTDTEIYRVREEATSLGLSIEYDRLSSHDGVYKQLIESDNIEAEIDNFPTDIEPATDDKPFFDNNIGFERLSMEGIKETFSQDENAIYALKDKPVAETTLIIILIQTILTAFILLVLPLFLIKKKDDEKTPKLFLIYFACIGLGYIMIQVSLIQKFTLFLGQPVYTMLTVISTMLAASGIGSIFSKKFILRNDRYLLLTFGIIALLAILIGFLTPLLFSMLVRFDIIFRVFISFLIIFIIGFFMGMPFPAGFTMIKDRDRTFPAYAWAVNGFFSVIGSVMAIIFAMIFGFKIVFLISGIIYLFASGFGLLQYSILKNNDQR